MNIERFAGHHEERSVSALCSGGDGDHADHELGFADPVLIALAARKSRKR